AALGDLLQQVVVPDALHRPPGRLQAHTPRPPIVGASRASALPATPGNSNLRPTHEHANFPELAQVDAGAGRAGCSRGLGEANRADGAGWALCETLAISSGVPAYHRSQSQG